MRQMLDLETEKQPSTHMVNYTIQNKEIILV